ncbi:MAG: hypothetical protein K8S16_16520 [Bacteroidales bacterium]|nr:hypothetical protein [Bacteroidales bacterium]
MKKVFLLLSLGMTCSILLFGQSKLLLENGSFVIFTHISIDSEQVKVNVNGETRLFSKTDILCIIPERGKSYTFRKKNNIKFKIAPKDIKNNYNGADIPRLFAYKYYKSNTDVSEVYKLFQDTKLSLFNFESYYNAQQQKIRSRATTATVLSVVLLAIAVGGFIRTLNTANSLSYNHIDVPNTYDLEMNNNAIWLTNHRYYKLKRCA